MGAPLRKGRSILALLAVTALPLTAFANPLEGFLNPFQSLKDWEGSIGESVFRFESQCPKNDPNKLNREQISSVCHLANTTLPMDASSTQLAMNDLEEWV